MEVQIKLWSINVTVAKLSFWISVGTATSVLIMICVTNVPITFASLPPMVRLTIQFRLQE